MTNKTEIFDYLINNGYKPYPSCLPGITRFSNGCKMIVIRDDEADFYIMNETVEFSRLNGLSSLSIVNWKRILKETGFVSETLSCVDIAENYYNNHAGMLNNLLS